MEKLSIKLKYTEMEAFYLWAEEMKRAFNEEARKAEDNIKSVYRLPAAILAGMLARIRGREHMPAEVKLKLSFSECLAIDMACRMYPVDHPLIRSIYRDIHKKLA